MAAEPQRAGEHGGHAQVERFNRPIRVGEETKTVHYTSKFDAVKLNSKMVLETFREDGLTG